MHMRCLFIAALAFMLALPVAAQDFQKGVQAFQRGGYATALREFRPLAEQGNAEAQLKLGVMYNDGLGVPQDYAKAILWYYEAAEQGNDSAQFYLGGMYEQGLGVSLDYVEAHNWYNLAAAQGHKMAANHRGIAESEMTPANVLKAQRLAREWMEKHGN